MTIRRNYAKNDHANASIHEWFISVEQESIVFPYWENIFFIRLNLMDQKILILNEDAFGQTGLKSRVKD
jgi:hypothetical protein